MSDRAPAAPFCGTELGDDAIERADDGEQGQDPFGMPEDVELVEGQTLEHEIGQHPVAWLGGTCEVDAEPVAHGGMGAIAADDLFRLDPLLAARGIAQGRADGFGLECEADQLCPALHPEAELLEARL